MRQRGIIPHPFIAHLRNTKLTLVRWANTSRPTATSLSSSMCARIFMRWLSSSETFRSQTISLHVRTTLRLGSLWSETSLFRVQAASSNHKSHHEVGRVPKSVRAGYAMLSNCIIYFSIMGPLFED